jgi:opacity protein-like surface antigen
MKKLLFALIAGAAAMGAAQAQQAGTPKAYVGVGIASADHSFDLPGTTNSSTDGFKASGKLFGGYEFDQTWGVEAGYTDFRKSHSNYTLNGVPGRADSDGHSFYIAGKATAPINEQWSVFGKLGAAQNKQSLSATDVSLNRSDSKTEVYGALGAQFNINKQVALTAEYERYGKSRDFGAKADVWTVAARYSF